MKATLNVLGAVTLAIAAACLPHAASADASRVVQSWRTNNGWLTELREHENGTRVCAAAKGFGIPQTFGLSIVRSGQLTVLTLIDDQRAPTAAGDMTFTAEGLVLGTFPATFEGRAWATTEADSQKVLQMVSRIPPGPLVISVADRRYEAELTGIVEARAQLQVCEAGASR